MSEIANIPIAAMNNIFESLMRGHQHVFWMRSSDYQQQLYVSDSFKQIWGVDASMLYDAPESFNDFILADEKKQFANTISSRMKTLGKVQEKQNLFHIINSHGEVKLLADQSFPIFDRHNNVVAVAGLCEDISSNAGSSIAYFARLKNEIDAAITQSLAHTLTESLPRQKKVAPSTLYIINNISAYFTQREAACLNAALTGCTAKEIAVRMNLSPRTVEEYFDNMRKKFNCRRKLELISKISGIL